MQHQRLADFRPGRVRSRQMNDLVLGLAGDRAGDRDPRSVGALEKTGIAGLPPGRGIEVRPVENDPAALVDARHRAFGRRQIGILAKQRLGLGNHHATSS
jgi:hypothetical protein